MAKTNAQRQSDYRARHLKDLDGQAERLNLLVNLHAKRALERLAACYAVTQREVLEGLKAQGSAAWQDLATDRVIVNDEISLSVVIVRCTPTPTGLLRWKIRFDTSQRPDITLVVRMDTNNLQPFDYYLFPRLDVAAERLRLAEDNDLTLDAYRFETLDFFYEIAAPVRIAEAA
jgi:hypothetical protein